MPGLQWMDSITDPDNITLNRLWKERRTMQTVVVGTGTWGELWVSMLPMMRWARQRIASTTDAITRSVRGSPKELAEEKSPAPQARV